MPKWTKHLGKSHLKVGHENQNGTRDCLEGCRHTRGAGELESQPQRCMRRLPLRPNRRAGRIRCSIRGAYKCRRTGYGNIGCWWCDYLGMDCRGPLVYVSRSRSGCWRRIIRWRGLWVIRRCGQRPAPPPKEAPGDERKHRSSLHPRC